MGKKSKKKGGATNKAARKEKLQERREQQLEEVDNNQGSADLATRQYFERDRVWYYLPQETSWDGTNSNNYRGIVKHVKDDSLDIIPLQSMIDGQDRSITVILDGDNVFPDFCDMTLRFDLGDRVLCSVEAGWVPKEVTFLWPIGENLPAGYPMPQKPDDVVQRYKCGDHGLLATINNHEQFCAAPYDDDDTIMKHPSTFRFDEGDNVIISAYEAVGIGRSTSQLDKMMNSDEWIWIDGVITAIDTTDMKTYAAYTCSFEVEGRNYSCYITNDNDEHIAKQTADPRCRLFEAIEQDCSRDHIMYLVKHYQIDIMAFRDLVVTKSLEYASYQALSWIQHECKIDIIHLKDDQGNNLLHKIALSEQATRFIKEAGRIRHMEDAPDWKLDLTDFDAELINGQNKEGLTWLQILVKRGDCKALDVVFSPHCGLGWELALSYGIDEDGLLSLKESVQESNNVIMRQVFDSFFVFRTCFQQCNAVKYVLSKTEDELFKKESMHLLQGTDASLYAKRLIRFFKDWKGYNKDFQNNPFTNIVGVGFFSLFKLLYEADETVFNHKEYSLPSQEDMNEYIQPELLVDWKEAPRIRNADIWTACTIDNNVFFHAYHAKDNTNRHDYLRSIQEHVLHPRHPSLLSLLHEKAKNESSFHDGEAELAKYKISLLEDSKTLEGRLMILDYLLQHNPTTKLKLNAIEAIRHRQCGVLRFMVDKGLVKMEANASSNKMFTKVAPKLKCLEKGSIPSSMTTASFLSFVAVEYDDLQTLQWLCESYETTSDTCDGWNLLHFSSYMGRVEILAWLYTQQVWQTLVTTVSKRKPFQHAYAVHIAASEGHIFLADFLLALKYHFDSRKEPVYSIYIDLLSIQVKDTKGKLPEFYTKKSPHDFVKDWAAKRNKKLMFEKNIKKLLQLVNESDTPVDKVKQFIISSKCLEPASWQDCYSVDGKSSTGRSFGEVLMECCSKRPDADFVDWLCTRLYFMDNSYFFGNETYNFSNLERAMELVILNKDDLLLFATENGHKDLVNYMSKGGKWLNNVACPDPATVSLLLKRALSVDPITRVRAKLLYACALCKIARLSDDEARNILLRGGQPDELDEVLQVGIEAKQSLNVGGYTEYGFKFQSSRIDYIVKPFDMSTYIHRADSLPDEHPLFKQIPFRGKSRGGLSQIHILLATEGFSELLEYCVRKFEGWTLEMKLEAVRVAAYFGHSSIVDNFVTSDDSLSPKEAARAAMCGAGEACRHRDLVQLVSQFGTPHDQLTRNKKKIDNMKGDSNLNHEQRSKILLSFTGNSLLCAVLNGYVQASDKNDLNTLQYLVNNFGYTHDSILFALEVLWDSCYLVLRGGSFFDFFLNMMKALNLYPFMHHKRMRSLCETVAKSFEHGIRFSKVEEDEAKCLEWLGNLAEEGIDIQQLISPAFHRYCCDTNQFPPKLSELEKKQLNNWSSFDIVKQEGTLEEIQTAIEVGGLALNSRDRGGLMLTHLSAAYDRVDLLEWLVFTKEMDIKSMDGQSRTVLDIAKASKATSSTKWITELEARRTIASFTQQNYHRLLAVRKHQRIKKATTTIQTIYRGYMIRKLYSGILVQRLEESQRFSAIWGHVIQQYNGINSNKEPLNWSSIRESVSDINQVEFTYDDSYFEDTDEQLSKALEGALQLDDDVGEGKATFDNEESSAEVVTKEAPEMAVESTSDEVSWLSFQMTSHVVKFLKQGDTKYKSFFVRRMQQLGSGERSRILQKRLKGSQSTIYETYLEQKSGFRILWTEEGDNIIIWFVAKHKEVSRLMQLIDDSKSRTARQQLSESAISDLRKEKLLPSQREAKKEVLLDVFSNVPLKLYDVSYQSIDDIATSSWSPKLHLTDEERDVVEADGTVLVLGRSGTGKTVCICNRMEYDRQVYGQDPTFSQLFVARSKRLCRYVSEATGNHDTNSFLTFDELIYDLDTSLPGLKGSDNSFFPSQRVDFQRFKQEFYNTQSSSSSKEKKVSAMILWTAIRTFIKGSIEAHQSPDGILPKDDFVAVEKLGKNRCRFPAEYRASMYNEFLKYEEYKAKLGLWDDIDRIQHLLSRLANCMKTDPAVFDGLRKSKIYVDEVQDYTQIEILLFFYLAGPCGLFLAGDPAQSVVEGTEFRFEEVRRVGYFVAESSGNRNLIPSKAKTVNVNFRSHAGILNCAASFLEYLFKYFPGSAKQLQTDYGLFQGSRPGVLHKVKTNQLATLLSDKLNGTVVLVHDESSDYWRKALGGYKLVYGIREAKGLEFKSVMILNFFSELPTSLHKPWRNLLLDREGQDFETKYPLVGTHLKLLYTGITRCIERLFFVETSSSIAGDTLVRWLKQNALATKNNINDIESMAMTSDEFLSEGFNNAEQAESAEELDLAYIALDRAVWCFEQADNLPLAAKARTNRRSIQFRLDLLKDSNDKEMVEVKGAQMVESLTREGLLLEVMNVFYSISPFMREYAKEQLESVLISKIRLALA